MPRRVDETPLAVLLLPRRLEALEHRARVEDLLRAPGAVAVDPARVSYGTLGRLPLALALGLAGGQATRLLRALRGTPRVVAIFEPVQVPLAVALLDRTDDDAELWYGGEAAAGRHADLHALAERRAAFAFSLGAAGDDPRALNRPLLERLEALGIESGRLGSERLGR